MNMNLLIEESDSVDSMICRDGLEHVHLIYKSPKTQPAWVAKVFSFLAFSPLADVPTKHQKAIHVTQVSI